METSHRKLLEASGKSTVYGQEHPFCITLGRRGDERKDILKPISKDCIHKISRGGQATLHSKGQLVIYPVLPLRSLKWGTKKYVGFLIKVSLHWMKELGIPCFFDDKEPGFYTEKGKIGFLGISIEKGVSLHGLSFNVSNDLSLFYRIRSCGKKRAHLDRIHRYRPEIKLEELFQLWEDSWKKFL